MEAVIPTPEEIAMAELNGWDPQEVADENARVRRVHLLMRRHSKFQLLQQAYELGLSEQCKPAGWTKQELAACVVRLERDRG